MKKLFVVFVVLVLVGLLILEISGTGLTLAKLAFIRREKASIEGESYLAIEFPEKVPITLIPDGPVTPFDSEVVGLNPDGKEEFRMKVDSAEFRAKVQLAFAQISSWIEVQPAQRRNGAEERRFFRVADARGQEGFAVLRDRRLTWVDNAGKILKQFNLTVIKSNDAPLIFMWEPFEEGGE